MSGEATESAEAAPAAEKQAETPPTDDGWGNEPSRRANPAPANSTAPAGNSPSSSTNEAAEPTEADARAEVSAEAHGDDGWGEDEGLQDRREAAREARLAEQPAELKDDIAVDIPHDDEPELLKTDQVEPTVEEPEPLETVPPNAAEIAHAREQVAQAYEDDRVDGSAVAEREAAITAAQEQVDRAFYQQATEVDEVDLPLPGDVIAARTTDNRIALADNVKPGVEAQKEYGGYIDVVMHGNADGTSSNIDGRETAFTLDQTAELIRSSPSWNLRPVRLMSCSTGAGDYAQDLANKLDVPVYAPSGILNVYGNDTRFIEPDKDGTPGTWRRFEPAS